MRSPARVATLVAVLLAATASADASRTVLPGQVVPPPDASPATPDTAEVPPIDEGFSIRFPEGRLDLRLRPDRLETGLPIVFEVDFRPEGVGSKTATEIQLPPTGTRLGDFEVLGWRRTPEEAETPDAAPDRPVARTWAVRTFGSGRVVLPAFDVSVDGVSGRTEARLVEVASVAGLDTAPGAHRDIEGAVEIVVRDEQAWWWVLGVFLVVAAIAAVIGWRRRRSTPPPPEPADTWALARLDALLEEGLVEAGRVRPFFFGLTDVARAFIDRRFGLAAPDRTTSEFIEEARRHPELGDDVARLLGNLLAAADRVKFAGDRPAREECDRAAATVRRFIVDSGPRPTESEETGTTTSHGAGDRRRAIRAASEGLDRLETRS